MSLDQIRRMPARTQITRHNCVEGWSAIGQWTGVPLKLLLAVGHGAPLRLRLRLRLERQLGYKQAKFVMRIKAVASLVGIGG